MILAGACIVRTVMDQLGRDALTVSDRGLRHGVLLERFGPRKEPTEDNRWRPARSRGLAEGARRRRQPRRRAGSEETTPATRRPAPKAPTPRGRADEQRPRPATEATPRLSDAELATGS